jgi:hypothetical protein
MVVLVYPPEYFKARDMLNNREEIFTIYRRLAQKYRLEFIDYALAGLTEKGSTVTGDLR